MNVRVYGADAIYATAAATAGEASAVVAGAANLYSILVTNSGPDQWLQLFDSATVPANGTRPLAAFNVPAAYHGTFDAFLGMPFAAGIAVCNSTTQMTKTLGAADCRFAIVYRKP